MTGETLSHTDDPGHSCVPYDEAFFESLEEGVRQSANAVVPLVIELFKPRSVLDVGSGTGVWLSVFHQNGVVDLLGVDGPWVDTKQLVIPTEFFAQHDLRCPLDLSRTFDLVLCLEVAEHLSTDAAAHLVKTLTESGDIVVFSAAIPFQGGEDHMNEQWPDYWADLFRRRGFECLDVLRPRIWDDDKVEWWYRQNIVCYVAETRADLLQRFARHSTRPLQLVHPGKYLSIVAEMADLHEEIAEWERGYATLEGDLAAAIDNLESTQADLEDTRAQLARIRNSTAWKAYSLLKSPLRLMTRKRLGENEHRGESGDAS